MDLKFVRVVITDAKGVGGDLITYEVYNISEQMDEYRARLKEIGNYKGLQNWTKI